MCHDGSEAGGRRCRKSWRIVFLFRSSLPSFLRCRCPPEFVLLFREFGGSLSVRDSHGRMATGESVSQSVSREGPAWVRLPIPLRGKCPNRSAHSTSH